MATASLVKGFATDLWKATVLVNKANVDRNIRSWLLIPVGIIVILLVCFAVDSLIGLSSVSFPASVAVMILLFAGLILLELVAGERRTRKVVAIIDVPTGFALRWINVFFIPSFVLLPLSPPIGGAEVGKIIAVFVVGFFVMMAVTAYLTRGLQLVLGSSKRAMTERAEELGNEPDSIPLATAPGHDSPPEATPASSPGPSRTNSTVGLLAPQRAQDPYQVRGSLGPPVECAPASIREAAIRRLEMKQAPARLTRPQRWAAFINSNFDRLSYLGLFLFIGLPVYYGAGYAMPVQLTLSVMAYFAALALPATWRRVLHPVLVSSAAIILGVWVLGLIKGDSLDTSLKAYQDGTKYLQLWKGKKGLAKPGAGDIFGTVLDASIVALALPMFNYRKELKQHFFAIVIPNVSCSLAALFGYPPLCYAIGISATRSLAFAERSLTLALAKPVGVNLGADTYTVAPLAIFSGILGALVGPWMLQFMRIPDDDYVTRGVTLGGNSSAIATAILLQTDPRAAALSSLSMSLFGIITIALTSVPPVVTAVRSLVGL